MIDRDRKMTYAELDAQSRVLAANLDAMGVRAGDRIAVWLPNSHAWLLTFIASARLGGIVFAINTRFRAREVEDILGRGRVDWLVLWPRFKGIAFADILDEIDESCMANLKGIVCYSEEELPTPAHVRGRPARDFRDLCESAWSADLARRDVKDHGVLVFTTSGTTALPKFVLHEQRTLIEHGRAVASAIGYDDTSRVLASTPFCGAFGFATLLGALVHGATIVSDPVFEAARAAQRVREHRVTHTFANDDSISKMIDGCDSAEDFASVKLFGFSSFSPTNNGLFERAAAHGIELTGLYGSSELNALVAIQSFGGGESLVKYRYRPGGRLVHPAARVRSRSPDGVHILPHGEPGELEIYSPCTMSGYLDQPEATAKVMTEEGYFRTGDVGFTVDDRHFVFLTRLGDSIRLSGFLVNPSEIEEVINAIAGIEASQVVGVFDGERQVAFAFVRLSAGTEVDEAAWKDRCKSRMAGYKVPVRFIAVADFPMVTGPNGVKVQRNRLREMAAECLGVAQPQKG
jgi:fatty-acyl-CoA synthase